MVLDFGKLGGSNIVDEAIDPRQIFSALNKAPKYSYPRDVQSQVWESWFQRRAEKDLVIKMNTGSGKTVVGLMILKSCLNEKQGPAAFFTPDKYLTDQVISEANELGIQVTTDERSPDFLSGKAILVANIHKLFNGKSVFGVGGEGIKIKLGSLLIDDAHACLNTIKQKFSIQLSSTHPAYVRLWPIIKQSLNEQSSTKVLEIESLDPYAQMRVPFWTWQKETENIVRVLYDYREDKELMFVWPLIKDSLNHCQCTIGGGILEISPTILPIDKIPSFRAASRRIYMSATISDETIFVSELQADEKSIEKVVVPKSADDLGDRMIMFPQASNPNLNDEQLRDFFKNISRAYNVVVLVPSEWRANFWRPVADRILDQDNISKVVEELKSRHVGLVIMVNRYDGIDLPGDSARVLVLDGIPNAQSVREKIENSLLQMSEEYNQKQVSRIEQGMGRATRSNDDYCAVFLMGTKLTHFLYSPIAKQKFSPATLAQIQLGEKVSEQIKGKDLNEIYQVMDLCLKRDPKWVAVSKSAISGITPLHTAKFTSWQIAHSKAFNLSILGQHQQGANLLQGVVKATKDESLKGYLMQFHAELLNFYDQSHSQQVLLAGAQFNRNILRPIKGINYSKINAPANDQASSAVEFYKQRYIEPNDCLIEVNNILGDLNFQTDTSSNFESAVHFMGKLLGYNSQRPDEEIGVGPDVLWAVGDLNYFVIECKNEVLAKNKVSKSHIEQLQSSQTWFESTYDRTCPKTAIMIHPSRELESTAFAPADVRVIDTEHLELLKKQFKIYFSELCHDGSIYDTQKVKQKIQQFGFDKVQFIERFTTTFKR